MSEYKSFRTTRKTHAVILRQPFIAVENKGKENERRYRAQYAEGQTTLEIENQFTGNPNKPHPDPTPIYITKGFKNLSVEENPLMLKAFEVHPDNVANGGRLFKEFDIKKEELLEIEAFEKEDEAKGKLKKASPTLIRAAAVWFLGQKYLDQNISTNKCKLVLRNAIEANAEVAGGSGNLFVDSFIAFMKEKDNEEKLLVAVAIEKGIIRIVAKKKIVWAQSGEAVFNGSQAQEVIREFAMWLKNDKEGREVSKLLSQKVDEAK